MKNSIYILLFFLIAFVACNKDEGFINPEENQNLNEADLKSGHKKDKVSVYHYDKDSDSWHVITISPNALPAHLKQGGYLATYVPDDNFEQVLIDLRYDTPPLDDYVPTANIGIVTRLGIDNRNISDLTGIEDFIALTQLWCKGNPINNLDVTNNTALTVLDCPENQLTSLDVTNNIALIYLSCWGNQLTSLDVTNNTVLTVLACGINQLTSLDISNNTALFWLGCGGNQLSSLKTDIIPNTALTRLSCGGNQLTALDITNYTALTWLGCRHNQLTSLDVTNNIALTRLGCRDNQLIALDVTPNTALTELHCMENQLTSLDISNNTALTHLDCWGNPELFCIQVNALPVPFTYNIGAASFSLDCGY